MKVLIFINFLLVLFVTYGQRKYDFDVPLRAKSNEGVYEWYIEQLDDTCDSLVNRFVTNGYSTSRSTKFNYT